MYSHDNPQTSQAHYPTRGTAATTSDPNVYPSFHQGQGQHQVYQQAPGHHMQQPQQPQQQYLNPIPVYNVAPTASTHNGAGPAGHASGHQHVLSHPAAGLPPPPQRTVYAPYPNGVMTGAMGVAVAAPPSTVAPFIKSIKKRKPGPLRKKCVWCSLTHGHSCNSNRCAVRVQLGGIGSSNLLERCRILKREVGEEVRIALETEGEAGIAKLERSLWDKKLRENPQYAHHAIPTSQSMPNLAAMARGGNATPTLSSSSSNTPASKKKQRATSVSPVLGASGRKTKGKKLASSMKRSSSHRSISSLSKNKMMDIAGDKLAILSLVCADMDAQLDNYAATA